MSFGKFVGIWGGILVGVYGIIAVAYVAQKRVPPPEQLTPQARAEQRLHEWLKGIDVQAEFAASDRKIAEANAAVERAEMELAEARRRAAQRPIQRH
jgi:hypothetical protein